MWKEQPAGKMTRDRWTRGSPMAEKRTKEMNFSMSLFQTSSALHMVLSGEPMESQPERLLVTLNTTHIDEHVRGTCEEYV